MKIILEVSEKNEGTSSPWWAILDPYINIKRGDVNGLAKSITGPFFSRDDAQQYLIDSGHNYSSQAIVYCLSGWNSGQYARALKNGAKIKYECNRCEHRWEQKLAACPKCGSDDFKSMTGWKTA